MLLSCRLGLFLYMVLPNDLVWRMLTAEERAGIAEGDYRHNNDRPDYADPEQYQDGVGFDTPIAPTGDGRGRYLLDFLARVRPASVLEIGPGSGRMTRAIVDCPSVTRYVAVDINAAFLEHLRPRLSVVPRQGFTFDLVHGTTDAAPAEQFDAIVLCSSVHHIPDRRALFASLAARLSPNGRVVAMDPTHYLGRIRKAVRKARQPGYLTHKLDDALARRLSTHAMCTLREYRDVTRRAGLEIANVEFGVRPPKVERWRAAGIPLGPLWRWAADDMIIECRRPSR